MADPLVASLSGEDVVETNSMAVVTTSCIVIRPVQGRSRVVLSLESVTDIKRIRTTHPGLLVIASGLFLIAAAAYNSKDSSPAVVPIAFLGILFLFAYLGTRRVSVVLWASASR